MDEHREEREEEYAYAIGKLGEGAFERVYRVVVT